MACLRYANVCGTCIIVQVHFCTVHVPSLSEEETAELLDIFGVLIGLTVKSTLK
jgi:hypothetical protein